MSRAAARRIKKELSEVHKLEESLYFVAKVNEEFKKRTAATKYRKEWRSLLPKRRPRVKIPKSEVKVMGNIVSVKGSMIQSEEELYLPDDVKIMKVDIDENIYRLSQLQEMKILQLKEIASEMGLKVRTLKTKNDLIEAIINNQSYPTP